MLNKRLLTFATVVWLCVFSTVGFAETFAETEAKAKSGDVVAQFTLGTMYHQGKGVAIDKAEAVKWYRKAAEAGNANAQTNLGTMYYHGHGVAKDEVKAAVWLRKAAEAENIYAQAYLGSIYQKGHGVKKDEAEAMKWYHQAAEGGHPEAQFTLGTMYHQGKGIAIDKTEAVKWYRKAAEAGNVNAQANLGYFYQKGHGVAKDEAKAVKWYHQAAEAGHLVAQVLLGTMYYAGQGAEKDQAEAVRWWRKAAEAGQPVAQFKLGVIYDKGITVTKDKAEATQWYRKAAAQGHESAIEELSKLGEKPPPVATVATTEKPKSVKITRRTMRIDNLPGQHPPDNITQGTLTAEDLAWESAKQTHTVAAYEAFIASYGEGKHSKAAYGELFYLDDEPERQWIRNISVTELHDPQKFHGGYAVPKTLSLDCLINQCDDMLIDKAPIIAIAKEGNVFILVEAEVESLDVLKRSFLMQSLGRFSDADGNKPKEYVWHAPAKNPEMAGWTGNEQWIHIEPGSLGTLKWMYQVPVNKVKNSRFVLWHREELVQ